MYIKEVIIVGFALFAMFFGAGNLIFPTFLGVETGLGWVTGFSGFVIADLGLSILAILASAECDGDLNKILGRGGRYLAVILGSAIMICLGPLLAIPRTAATTYEIGIVPLYKDFNSVLFSIIFFAVVLILCIKPSNVIDIIGIVLTPVLLAALLVIIVLGIVRPIGDIEVIPRIEGIFAEGITQGYQTMDALGAVALSTVIITTLKEKGFEKRKQRVSLSFKAVIIAAVGLFVVYCGLTFLGATIAKDYLSIPLDEISQTSIIVEITYRILGNIGEIVLSVIIALACLTTAIGLTSATGEYFSRLTHNKLKYEIIVIIVCVFSAFISNFGVSTIIAFSSPILKIIYPATITFVILTLFSKRIKNDNVFKFAAYAALVISIINVLNDTGIYMLNFIKYLPLSAYGFGWVVPVVFFAIVGDFISTNN